MIKSSVPTSSQAGLTAGDDALMIQLMMLPPLSVDNTNPGMAGSPPSGGMPFGSPLTPLKPPSQRLRTDSADRFSCSTS